MATLICVSTSNTRDSRDNLHKPKIINMSSRHIVIENNIVGLKIGMTNNVITMIMKIL